MGYEKVKGCCTTRCKCCFSCLVGTCGAPYSPFQVKGESQEDIDARDEDVHQCTIHLV